MSNSYSLFDFTESLNRVGIQGADVERVVAAWGYSPEGYGSWEGGFVMWLKDWPFRLPLWMVRHDWLGMSGRRERGLRRHAARAGLAWPTRQIRPLYGRPKRVGHGSGGSKQVDSGRRQGYRPVILWTDGVMPMRDANIDLEASRYDPEPGTRMLTSAVVLFFLVLMVTLLMAGSYMQAVRYRAQQTVEEATR